MQRHSPGAKSLDFPGKSSVDGKMNPIIVIPARLKARRLPNKPLADLHGSPMIEHVWRRAVEAAVGPVIVACGDTEIADAIRHAGGNAIMTDPDCPSGSDRVFEAVSIYDEDGTFDIVINLQGDLPTMDPRVLRTVLTPLEKEAVDIASLAGPLTGDDLENPNVVKAVLDKPRDQSIGRALAFTREKAAYAVGHAFHHIGIYAYRRSVLERFVSLPQSPNERRERLEQLRALDAGMRIDVACVDTIPFGVDTPADLARVRAMLDPATSGDRP